MPTVDVPNRLSLSDKRKLLERLEYIGLSNFTHYMNQRLLNVLDNKHLRHREFLSRYLLLVAALDQQADSDSARKTVVSLYLRYGADLFLNPHQYVGNLYEVVELAASLYRPRTRVLRLKNNAALLLRIGGFLLALVNITERYGGLLNYLSLATSPRGLLDLILKDLLLSGLLYEKAARMYVGWVSHPKLWINISNGKWKPSEVPMAVNGHVCKVLARTGFLSSAMVEDVKTYIVEAENERKNIEKEIDLAYPEGDRLFIDFGAFYIGITYCYETNPRCSQCPISHLCKKNIVFRAY
ncbi:MAG: hypothetical protein QXK97_00470 [Acidilobaceae archaeon]